MVTDVIDVQLLYHSQPFMMDSKENSRPFVELMIPIKAANRRKKKVVNAGRKRDKETERETE